MLENVENFALMATKRWDAGYQELLDLISVSSLETRRLQSSLCMLYRIVHKLCYFPSNVVMPRSSFIQRTNHHEQYLNQPFAHTCSLFYSFIPRSTHIWNSLPEALVTAPLPVIKRNVVQYL